MLRSASSAQPQQQQVKSASELRLPPLGLAYRRRSTGPCLPNLAVRVEGPYSPGGGEDVVTPSSLSACGSSQGVSSPAAGTRGEAAAASPARAVGGQQQQPKSLSGGPLPSLDWSLPAIGAQRSPQAQVTSPSRVDPAASPFEASASRSPSAAVGTNKPSAGTRGPRRRGGSCPVPPFAVPRRQVSYAGGADSAGGDSGSEDGGSSSCRASRRTSSEQLRPQLLVQKSGRSFTAADVQQLRDAATAPGGGAAAGSCAASAHKRPARGASESVLKGVLKGLGVWSSKMDDLHGPPQQPPSAASASSPCLPELEAAAAADGSVGRQGGGQTAAPSRTRAVSGAGEGGGEGDGVPVVLDTTRRLGIEHTSPLLGADITTHVLRAMARRNCRW